MGVPLKMKTQEQNDPTTNIIKIILRCWPIFFIVLTYFNNFLGGEEKIIQTQEVASPKRVPIPETKVNVFGISTPQKVEDLEEEREVDFYFNRPVSPSVKEDLKSYSKVQIVITFDPKSEPLTKAATHLKKFFEDNYPQTNGNVVGYYAPLPFWVLRLSSFSDMLQLTALFVLIFGKRFLGSDHFAVQYITNNKLTCLIGGLALYVLISRLQRSGVFDIEVNGELLFSKNNEFRFPTGQEIVDILGKRGIDSAWTTVRQNTLFNITQE